MMHITTTFWSDEIHSFDKLFYVRGSDKKVLFEADLNNVVSTLAFFENIADFVVSPISRKAHRERNYDTGEWYQFMVAGNKKSDEPIFVKWFNLHVGDVKIGHDIAFDTTLIYKNGQRLSFGNFPIGKRFENRKLPMYRKINIQRRAYKYLANQVRALLKSEYC